MAMGLCPLCNAEGRLLTYPGAKKLKCPTCGIIDLLALPAPSPPTTVESEPVIYANGHDTAATLPVPREPGADLEEDTFQEDLLRWKARVFAVAENLLVADTELRTKQGEDLFIALVEALEKLIRQIATYQPPEALPPDGVRPDLEELARKAIRARVQLPSPAKEEPVKPLPMVEELELGELYTLIDEWDRQPWVWEGILPHASLSLICGKSETGKSTFVYSLIYAIVTGTEFLGRKCEQGKVLYLAGDPASEIVLGKLFRSLGITRGITVLRGALVAEEHGMKRLRETIKRVQPILVVADTLAATVQLDTDKYGQSVQTQQPLSQMAREFKPNFMMSHHSQKSAMDTYSVIDAALGSVGVAAVASTRMQTRMYRKKGERFYTFEMSNLRIGQPLEGEMIMTKDQSGLVVQGEMWRDTTSAIDKQAILDALAKYPLGLNKRTLKGETRPILKPAPFYDALDELLKEGKIQITPQQGRGGTAHIVTLVPQQDDD